MTRLPASRPSPSATIVAVKKYPSAFSASPPARAMSPRDAMPMMTVTKMTGPVTALISWMNASASHCALSAASSATRPKMIPATIAMTTQNHSCRYTGVRLTCASPCSATGPGLPRVSGNQPPTISSRSASRLRRRVWAARSRRSLALATRGGTARGRPLVDRDHRQVGAVRVLHASPVAGPRPRRARRSPSTSATRRSPRPGA